MKIPVMGTILRSHAVPPSSCQQRVRLYFSSVGETGARHMELLDQEAGPAPWEGRQTQTTLVERGESQTHQRLLCRWAARNTGDVVPWGVWEGWKGGFTAPNRAARQSHFWSHVYIHVLRGKQNMDASEKKEESCIARVWHWDASAGNWKSRQLTKVCCSDSSAHSQMEQMQPSISLMGLCFFSLSFF